MDYTIKAFAQLTGVTTRTLRYYDEVGLLPPKKINSSGYRIYGKEEVEKLQHILFLRELEMPLKQIQSLLNQEEGHYLSLLKKHREALLEKREQFDRLLDLVDQSIMEKEGRINMSDKQKFEAFKKQQLEDNEKNYGKEIREKYGEKQVEASNRQFLNMSEKDYQERQEVEKELFELLSKHQKINIPSTEAEKIFRLHKAWISQAWGRYSAESHKGVAQMYVESEEFTCYYDERTVEGAARFLRDVIHHYA
ncbi:MerR family transcriptional regulator [Vagococcus elongatus]|uniref:MerR family transcriptional regulator n=1 Tax=Vagococcus elongatus TaxID=180344 RepID=A0A430AP12_9ENTE|nr:MerR family transcriptional regulator [Vagococcus elongatus]